MARVLDPRRNITQGTLVVRPSVFGGEANGVLLEVRIRTNSGSERRVLELTRRELLQLVEEANRMEA